jgi:hypothetical protein
MRSLFPGMNPYLEQPELWSAVHSQLDVAIADDLDHSLPLLHLFFDPGSNRSPQCQPTD